MTGRSPARDSDNANAIVDSVIYCGPKGSTLPTDLTTDIDAALEDLGWLTDTGIGEAPTTNTNVRRGINGSIVKTIKTSDDTSFTFECYERNAVTVGLVRPGSTPATMDTVTTTNVKAYLGSNEKAFVLHIDYGTYKRRVAIARGEAFLTGTIQDKPGDLAVLQFRIDCYPAADGTKYIDITDNPAEEISGS